MRRILSLVCCCRCCVCALCPGSNSPVDRHPCKPPRRRVAAASTADGGAPPAKPAGPIWFTPSALSTRQAADSYCVLERGARFRTSRW